MNIKDGKHFHDSYLKMTLADRPKSRLQKYRLTDKGHGVLK